MTRRPVTFRAGALSVTGALEVLDQAPARMMLGTTELAYDALVAATGRMDIRRSYDGAMPASVDRSKAAADLAAGRVPWVSFTSVTASNARSFFESCVGRGPVWVTGYHEANNGPKMQPAEHRALYAMMAAARDAAKAVDVKLVTILTAEPYRSSAHLPWAPDPAHVDVVAADAYLFQRPPGSPVDPKMGGLGQARTMAYLVGELPAYAKSIGKPWALGEFGAHPFPDAPGKRPAWLRDAATWAEANGCAAMIYFHSGNGESGPWWLDRYHFPETAPGSDPQSLAAWRDLLNR